MIMYFESLKLPTANPTKSTLASENRRAISDYSWVKHRKKHLFKVIPKISWIIIIPCI